jgi:hypothetical protein
MDHAARQSYSEAEETQQRFVRETLSKEAATKERKRIVEELAKKIASDPDGDEELDAEVAEAPDTAHMQDAVFNLDEEHTIKEAEIRWKVEHTDSMGMSPMASTDPLAASKSIPFQRVRPTLQDGTSMFDSPDEIAIILIRAMKMRQRYLRVSCQSIPDYLNSFLSESSAVSRIRSVSENIHAVPVSSSPQTSSTVSMASGHLAVPRSRFAFPEATHDAVSLLQRNLLTFSYPFPGSG